MLIDEGSLVTPDGVHDLGVLGAVGPGVPAGLVSRDGGPESEGPIENLGVGLGCGATPAACSTEAAVSFDGFSSFGGDWDLCGVMTSGAWCRMAGTACGTFPSRECVAAGVRGGECTAECGGDGFGDASTEPAGRCLLLGVPVPDGTLEAGCEPGRDTGSNT